MFLFYYFMIELKILVINKSYYLFNKYNFIIIYLNL